MKETERYSQYPYVNAFCEERAAAGEPVHPDFIPNLERVERLFNAGRGNCVCKILGADLGNDTE